MKVAYLCGHPIPILGRAVFESKTNEKKIMEFKEYQSKPIIRRAYEIKTTDTISQNPNQSWAKVTTPEGAEITFKVHEEVMPGDYIVHLNESDIYHCKRSVFLERNEVITFI